MTKIEGLLTEYDVADAIGVSRLTLRNWRSGRKGPPSVRIGRKAFYRPDALNAWIKSREKSFSPKKRSGR